MCDKSAYLPPRSSEELYKAALELEVKQKEEMDKKNKFKNIILNIKQD